MLTSYTATDLDCGAKAWDLSIRVNDRATTWTILGDRARAEWAAGRLIDLANISDTPTRIWLGPIH